MTKLFSNPLLYTLVLVFVVLVAKEVASQHFTNSMVGQYFRKQYYLEKLEELRERIKQEELKERIKQSQTDKPLNAKSKRSIPDPSEEPMETYVYYECVCSLPECFRDEGKPGHCITRNGCFYQNTPYGYATIDKLMGKSTSSVTYGCLEMINIKRSCTDILSSQEFPEFGALITLLKKPNARTIFRCCKDRANCNKDMGLPDDFLTGEPISQESIQFGLQK